MLENHQLESLCLAVFLLEDYFEDPSTAFDDRGYLMRIIILMK